MSRALLYVAFLLSGAAGLVYEVVWSRYLALFVGHSAEAAVLVISMFLGGLSLGAWLTSRVSDRLQRPVRAYALVEIAIGVIGLAFHLAFLTSTGLSYEVLFPLFPGAVWTQLVKWTVAGFLVFVPAVLMGATFPLMAAAVVRQARSGDGRTGRVLAALYGLNSLGGAAAVLVTGFVLIPAFGLPGSSIVAAGLNGAAALLAWWAARGPSRVQLPTPAAAPHRVVRDDSAHLRLLLVVAGGTALASFAYEVAWMRMLALAMGNATHAFELMLSAFILGLALGAFLVSRWADRVTRPLVTLGIIQCLMGALAVATVPAWSASFTWVADLVTELPRDDAGYSLFSLARYGMALLVMLPATVLAGTTLPLITNTLLRGGAGEAAIGRTYAVNTAGSIAGVALAGLVLLPWLGLRALLGLGATLDLALGLLLLARTRPAPVRAWGLAATSGVVLMLALAAPAWNPAVLTSGVYRTGRTLTELPEVLYYADGRSATIGVHRGADSLYVLTTNGKPDASLTARWLRATREELAPAPITQQDESTQMLTALISGAYARSGKNDLDGLRAAVIGHGSGISGHFLLVDTAFAQVTTIEIEPRVLDASRIYYPANGRVFDDPRSHLVIGDA
ncbi:MAG: fused MFS/spermidine synthase, partial [Gemmatimonadetes bacterium]|nr:fused MFS/spermidine synthase [Gemmatimonadota bacterium]